MSKQSRSETQAVPYDAKRNTQSVGRLPWWVVLLVVLGAALTLTGALIGKLDPTLLTGGTSLTDAGRVYADYMFARNLSIAVLLLAMLALQARRMLAGFMVLTALIQFVDSCDDLARGAWVLVPGLVVFALLFLLGAWRLFGQAPWRLEAWRD